MVATKEKAPKAKKGTVKMVGIPTVKKAKKIPYVSLQDSRFMGDEPKWDVELSKKLAKKEFEILLRRSLGYYRYFNNQKDFKKLVVEWAQNNMALTKEQISALVSSNPNLLPMTACSLVRTEKHGMTMREDHVQYVKDRIMKAIANSYKVANEDESDSETVTAVEKKKAYAPTIQDRLAVKSAEIIGEIEGQLDNSVANKATTRVYDIITKMTLAQAQVGKVRAHFQRQIDEMSEFVAGTDEQLTEGYSNLKNVDIKRIGAFYVALMADLDSYSAAKKAAKKVKARRPINKDKVAAKVKYMKESKELKVVSAPVTDIIGAQVLWVFNTKTRKIGKYVADAHSAFGLKGTSITGYSESSSVQKTIRKPEEQLREFMKSGKVALRTYLTDIKSVETKLNGRLNADILLLKIEM